MQPHLMISAVMLFASVVPAVGRAEFRAGAAVVDVTPVQYPVLVNGGMLSRSTDKATSPINARAIVLDDGRERVGIVVVDSCMIARPVLDEAKELASQRTKLRPDRILISATHTHTAPASMGALGTDAQEDYLPVLRAGIAEALAKAEANLEPARVGWGVTRADEFTAVRRWIRRPDRLAEDPFGNLTVRANMHAGRDWDDVVGESGPEDPDLLLIALQSTTGRPIAVLANFSMHYFSGVEPLNADYFGLFCRRLAEHVQATGDGPPFVAVMSHGCSGDIWRRDYTKPPDQQLSHEDIEEYAADLAEIAAGALGTIEYAENADLAMAESRFRLNYRVPDRQRLEWAQRVVAEMGDRPPKDTTEVYAREQIILHERQSTEVVVQALRIGSIGIATTPTETYALTGLKIKLQSPLEKTMVIELANGGDGYIPPPEQHLLGGYNTWAARSAGLEVQAEPKIAETALRLLEDVTGESRRTYRQSLGPLAERILAERPVAYWRLDELTGPTAIDSSGNGRDAVYDLPVAYFLAGPQSPLFCGATETNRAVHTVGGRVRARLPEVGDHYSVSLWFWNGMPADGREVAGWVFSRGRDNGLARDGLNLGVGGTDTVPGKLILLADMSEPLVGSTRIERWTWNHVLLTRDGGSVRVYLNGNPAPEIETADVAQTSGGGLSWFFGGRSDNNSNWEGRIDEIAVFDRPLKAGELAQISTSD